MRCRPAPFRLQRGTLQSGTHAVGFTLISIDDWLDEIRHKRDRLWRSLPKELRPYRERWEEHHHEHGRAAPDDVTALEREAGITLPQEYRRFVVEIADGGFGPGEGLLPVSAAIGDAPDLFGPPARPFCVEPRDDGYYRIAGAAPDDDVSDLCGGAVLLAHTGCGCFDALVVSGEHTGEVWGIDSAFWQYRRPDGSPTRFLDWYEQWLDGWLR